MKKLLLIFLIPFIVKAQSLTLLFSDDDVLNFTDITLAYSYTEYVSDSIVWNGGTKNVSVTDCYYRIGLNGTITNTSGSITFGDTLWLVDTTGATGSIYGGTLTIGGASDEWSISVPSYAISLNGAEYGVAMSNTGFDLTSDTLTIVGNFKNTNVGAVVRTLWCYGNGSTYFYELSTYNDGLYARFGACGSGTMATKVWYGEVVENEWSSYTMVIDWANKLVDMTIDDSTYAQQNFSSVTGDCEIAANATERLTVGGSRYSGGYGQYFIGEIGKHTFTRTSDGAVTMYDFSGTTDYLDDKSALEFGSFGQDNDLTGVGL